MNYLREQFDFFRSNDLIYLDSGATTQIPDSVLRIMDQSLRYRGNPGRSEHKPANHNRNIIENARKTISQFISAEAEEIVFTRNTTDSINLAVDAIAHEIAPGDEIIISIVEHHSNLLPYYRLCERGAIIKIADITNGIVCVDNIKTLLTSRTKIVALTHCSNILGSINPVTEIGDCIKQYNPSIMYVIDGAQASSHIPVNVKQIQCDFYAFSGHKMYAPDGIGVLYVNKDVQHRIKPNRIGGATISSLSIIFESNRAIISPEFISPTRSLEGGTEHISGAAALAEAVRFIESFGWDAIRQHELELTSLLLDELKKIDEITVYGPTELKNKIGLVSFSVKDGATKKIAESMLKENICIRFGSHCAFPISERLGSETLRLSFGIYNRKEDVFEFMKILKKSLGEMNKVIPQSCHHYLSSITMCKKTKIIHSIDEIITEITTHKNKEDSEIVIMGGHFLGIPDTTQNTFWPSIKPMLPEHLHQLLDEFGMTSFPLFTWDAACYAASALKKSGFKTSLAIIANETTGINELRLSSANKTEKTAADYRNELLSKFGEHNNIPSYFSELLSTYNLSKNDLIQCGDNYFFQETILRKGFKNFISKNKEYFNESIEYTADKNGAIDLAIHILDDQEQKSCHFNTFGSKTGGRFCIVEVAQFIAELCGISEHITYKYISERVKKPKIQAKNKILIMLTPAMCNNAVTSGSELYLKLFLQNKTKDNFTFINIPYGPNAEKSIFDGIKTTIISNKNSLQDVKEMSNKYLKPIPV